MTSQRAPRLATRERLACALAAALGACSPAGDGPRERPDDAAAPLVEGRVEPQDPSIDGLRASLDRLAAPDAPAPGSLERAELHLQVGRRYLDLGDYARAGTHFDLAREGRHESLLGLAWHLSGYVHWMLGSLQRAIDDYQRAAEAYGAHHPEAVEVLRGLGDLRREIGDVEGAKEAYGSALDRLSHLEDEWSKRASVQVSLGALHHRCGDLDEAQRLYDLAAGLVDANGGDQRLEARLALDRAELLLDRGQAALALPELRGLFEAYRSAGDLGRANFKSATPEGATREALARALAAVGQGDEAVEVALDMVADAAQAHLEASRELRDDLARAAATHHRRALDLACSILVSDPGGASAEGVFEAIVRQRAVVLDELVRRGRALRSVSRRIDLQLDVERTRAEQSRLTFQLLRGGRVEADVLAGAEQAARRAEAQLAQWLAGERAPTVERVGLDQVRAALPPDTVLVSFCRYVDVCAPRDARGLEPSAYVAFLERGGGAGVVVEGLGPAAGIDARIERWCALLRPGGDLDACRAAGAEVRAALWQPLARHVAPGVRQVLLVPDGALHLVQFAALPSEDGAWLIERAPVLHTLSSEREVVEYGAPAPTGRGLLAVGEPDYGDARDAWFAPLAQTGREVRAIAAVWRRSVPAAEPAVLLEGAAADEASFLRKAPGKRVLHLATHGFFLERDGRLAARPGRGIGAVVSPSRLAAAATLEANPMLRSGLALARANLEPAEDGTDGILTADELAGLDLAGVEWAVLSACDTGRGVSDAGEGVLGLRYALRTAGVRTVILSLWPVEDASARAWMERLYEQRFASERSTAQSVHAASLARLAELRGAGESTHPGAWCPFVAAGDWH